MDEQTRHDTFTEFQEFPRVGSQGERTHRTLVKASQIIHRGEQEVHLVDDDPNQPNIIVQKDGERVVAIDFHCKCGCSTTVRFEYDEE